MKPIKIQALLMENGEVICCGRSLGWAPKDFEGWNGRSVIEDDETKLTPPTS